MEHFKLIAACFLIIILVNSCTKDTNTDFQNNANSSYPYLNVNSYSECLDNYDDNFIYTLNNITYNVSDIGWIHNNFLEEISQFSYPSTKDSSLLTAYLLTDSLFNVYVNRNANDITFDLLCCDSLNTNNIADFGFFNTGNMNEKLNRVLDEIDSISYYFPNIINSSSKTILKTLMNDLFDDGILTERNYVNDIKSLGNNTAGAVAASIYTITDHSSCFWYYHTRTEEYTPNSFTPFINQITYRDPNYGCHGNPPGGSGGGNNPLVTITTDVVSGIGSLWLAGAYELWDYYANEDPFPVREDLWALEIVAAGASKGSGLGAISRKITNGTTDGGPTSTGLTWVWMDWCSCWWPQ